jgi:hypothetical protein
VATAASALACAGTGPSPGAPPAPAQTSAAERGALAAQLVPSDSLRPGFTLRQRLRFRTGPGGGDRKASFEAVVQVDCEEVLVVGLTPFGTRLFTIRQVGRETEFAWLLDDPWPFQPERILLDVHRSFLYPLADPPLADGRHLRRFGGVSAVETWRDSRLVERSIDEGGSAGPAGPPNRWVARYEGGWGADAWPGVIRLESQRYGYTIEIVTLERRPLACAP